MGTGKLSPVAAFIRDVLVASEVAIKAGAEHDRLADYLDDLAADLREYADNDLPTAEDVRGIMRHD